jgi:two-component system sensor histidine kinase HydH
MKTNSKKWRLQLLGSSPWLLGAACILLLLVIAFFAVSNYTREKQLIKSAIEQKGLTLVRFINSAVRDSVRSKLMDPSYEKWEIHMQAALELAAEQPGVDSIVLADKNGNIVVAADEKNSTRKTVDPEELELIRLVSATEEPRWRTQIIQQSETGEKKALLASAYAIPGLSGGMKNNGHRGMGSGRFRFSQHFSAFQEDLERLHNLAPVYLVQLDLSQFTAPLNRQLIQIILELAAIALVGLGGTLSFFTLRGLKGSEKKLAKMRTFNEIVVSSLPVGLIATDENGLIQVCNGAAAKIIQLDQYKSIGKNHKECLPAALYQMLGEKNDSGNERKEIFLAPDSEKSGQTLDVTVVTVSATSEIPAGAVMLLRDLTQVKQLEAELQRNERLAVIGKMAAGVAHELRNPLSSIKGLALLLKGKLEKESSDTMAVNTLVSEVERLNRSIGELLDYAKPGDLLRQPCAIEGIIEKTLSLIEPDLASLGVIVEKDLGADIPLVVVDQDKISQVLLNIFLNSLQALEDNSLERHLNIYIRGTGNTVLVRITDNGSGIAPEHLKRIFDPYFTTKSSGTGLGLALSLKIIEEHGGKLLVSSVPGKQTEVQLLLPSS